MFRFVLGYVNGRWSLRWVLFRFLGVRGGRWGTWGGGRGGIVGVGREVVFGSRVVEFNLEGSSLVFFFVNVESIFFLVIEVVLCLYY